MSEKCSHEGHRERLRQRYIDASLDAFADHEVIELLLTYSIPRRDVNELAHRVLDTFGSFSAVADASVDELCTIKGISQNSAVLLSLISRLSKRYELDRIREKQFLNSTGAVFKYGQSLYQGIKYECMYLLCLDSKCKLLRTVELAKGTIDSVTVYPRLVVEKCLSARLTALYLCTITPAETRRPAVRMSK